VVRGCEGKGLGFYPPAFRTKAGVFILQRVMMQTLFKKLFDSINFYLHCANSFTLKIHTLSHLKLRDGIEKQFISQHLPHCKCILEQS